jgi:hypothetical protein
VHTICELARESKEKEHKLTNKELSFVTSICQESGTAFQTVLDDMQYLSFGTVFIYGEHFSKLKSQRSSADVLKQKDDRITLILFDLRGITVISNRSDSSITESTILALAETLYRVPIPIYELNKDNLLVKTPEYIYSWAITKTNIMFPYITLSDAEAHITSVSEASARQTSWGFRNDKLILPRIESIQESNTWVILTQLCKNLFKNDFIEYTYDIDDTVPELSNAKITKDESASAVILRLIELSKSPNTATFRTGKNLNLKEISKNCVDFVVLDEIFRNDKQYKNLKISDRVKSQCIRIEKHSRPDPKDSNKAVLENKYVGYKLSEIFSKYITTTTSKTPENEPFMRFIIGICKGISAITKDDFVIPKSVFVAPSVDLIRSIRKGPKITTKKGSKENFYYPFSFVKSKECSLIPENIKSTMVDLGSKITKSLHSVNKLPIKEANDKLPLYNEYIRACYSISDQCRREWRTRCSIPEVTDLVDLFNLGYSGLISVEPDLVKDLKSHELTFRPFTTNSNELSSAKNYITELYENRKKERLKSSGFSNFRG